MMKCHELFGFMSAGLAADILNYAYSADKEFYKTTLASVAEYRRVRPAFFEKKPRVERHKDMISTLSSPFMETAAGLLLRTWLVKNQSALLADFLDGLGIPHKNGVVEQFPSDVDGEKLKATVEKLLGKYPKEHVVVYLNAFCAINEADWPHLKELLQSDSRLQFD
jgi:hypothetical protein